MSYLSQRSKTVGGAACIGDNINIRFVLLFIYADNKHRSILAGSRNDDLLSATL